MLKYKVHNFLVDVYIYVFCLKKKNVLNHYV